MVFFLTKYYFLDFFLFGFWEEETEKKSFLEPTPKEITAMPFVRVHNGPTMCNVSPAMKKSQLQQVQ